MPFPRCDCFAEPALSVQLDVTHPSKMPPTSGDSWCESGSVSGKKPRRSRAAQQRGGHSCRGAWLHLGTGSSRGHVWAPEAGVVRSPWAVTSHGPTAPSVVKVSVTSQATSTQTGGTSATRGSKAKGRREGTRRGRENEATVRKSQRLREERSGFAFEKTKTK